MDLNEHKAKLVCRLEGNKDTNRAKRYLMKIPKKTNYTEAHKIIRTININSNEQVISPVNDNIRH